MGGDGAGNNTYVGGAGADTVKYTSVAAKVAVNLSAGTASGTDIGTDVLSQIENIIGGKSDDSISGSSGNNVLNGYTGADTMIGGLGDDIYYVDNASDVVTESSDTTSGGIDTIISTVTRTLGSFQETLTLSGAVAINGTGNSLANTLLGNGAANVLSDDSGDDILNGGGGADTMGGGLGNDTYYVDNAADVVSEISSTGGVDTVIASVNRLLGNYQENLVLSGAAAINGTGNSLANTLTGNSAANVLNGSIGADSMVGGLGNDTYYVDNAADVVSEISSTGGVDTVIASVNRLLGNYQENLVLSGAAAINGTGNSLANTLTGNSAANVLNGSIGADSMVGGLGNDTYYVDNAADVVSEISSTGGVDTVIASVNRLLGNYQENLVLSGAAAINGTGNSLANTLLGNGAANVLSDDSGDDILNGGGGADTMGGGLGNDTYYVDSAADVVSEISSTGGVDTVIASVNRLLGNYQENLVLSGTSAINGTGNSQANTLTGNSAANVLNGSIGADTMVGGLGNDTYYVDSAADVVSETSSTGGVDTVIASVNRLLGNYQENLVLSGTSAINGTGNSQANTLTGNSAANVLNGSIGADTMVGGLGNDTYYVDSAADVVSETSSTGGVDTVIASVNRLLGNYQENLVLSGAAAINGTGNSLANTLTGNSAANVLNGSIGADTMVGGLGNDTYYVDSAADVVSETSSTGGVDTVIASVNRLLGNYQENLVLSGASAINGTGNSLVNTLTGNSAANVLDGGVGNDMLSGGVGNDRLVGGAGKDVLTGGVGNDIFDFNAFSETGLTSTSWDVISDFVRGSDKIDLSTLDANTATTGNDSFREIIGNTSAFTSAGQLKVANGVLYGNTDADNTAEFAIQLIGVTSLATLDFTL